MSDSLPEPNPAGSMPAGLRASYTDRKRVMTGAFGGREQVVGTFGGTGIKDLDALQADAPVLVVKGLALFGGVSVIGPKAGKLRRR